MASTVKHVPKQGVITGIDDMFIAIMSVNESPSQAPTYGTDIYQLPIVKEISVEYNESQTTFYASNKPYDSSHVLAGATMTATTMKLDSDLYAELTGQVTGINGGYEIRGGAIARPYVAVGFAHTMHNGKKKYFWFPKTKWSLAEDVASTQEDSLSEQNSEFEITVYALDNTDGFCVWADEEAEANKNIDFSKWFAQVITSTKDIPTITSGASVVTK